MSQQITTNKKQSDQISDDFEDAAFFAALEIDQMEMEIQHLHISPPNQNNSDVQQKFFGQLPPGIPPLSRSLEHPVPPKQPSRHCRFNSDNIQEDLNKQQQQVPTYNVVQVVKSEGAFNYGPSRSSQRQISSDSLKELLENKFISFSKVLQAPICPQNYNIHMLYRYITELYPALYPRVLQTCGSGLKISFLFGIQPQKIQKNRLIIDIRDQHVSSLIDKLERMFLGVIECVDLPSYFGIAFITKNTYRYDQTCHLKLQYCNGNIGTIHSSNYKLIKNSTFNIFTICDSNDRWPLISCYSLAGLNPYQNGLINYLFPSTENEKKTVLDVQSRQNFYLADLSEQQRAAVTAIIRGVAAPLPFVIQGQNEYEIGDVIVECILELLDAGNICLIVCSEFDPVTQEIIDDIRDISQHAQNVLTFEQITNSLDKIQPSTALFVQKLEGTEVCWNDKRPHFDHIIFMHADEIEEEFLFTMLAGIQSFVLEQDSKKSSHITLCGRYPCIDDGIFHRLLQCSIYNSDVEEEIDYDGCEQVLQTRKDLFQQEKFPGWISDLWLEYISSNGGNPNYICRL